MAIDSRDKRASAASFLFMVSAFAPDAAIDSAADRMHAAGAYRGIVAASPTVSVTPSGRIFDVSAEARLFTVDDASRVFGVDSESRVKTA